MKRKKRKKKRIFMFTLSTGDTSKARKDFYFILFLYIYLCKKCNSFRRNHNASNHESKVLICNSHSGVAASQCRELC